jgi:6-O-methylguanine DNA methyltransferase, DNA binding domain
LLSPRPDLSLSANFQSRAPLLGSPPVSRADAAPDFSGRSGAQLDRNAVLAGGAVGAVLAYAGAIAGNVIADASDDAGATSSALEEAYSTLLGAMIGLAIGAALAVVRARRSGALTGLAVETSAMEGSGKATGPLPCHRVIGSTGSLVGYGGGLACPRVRPRRRPPSAVMVGGQGKDRATRTRQPCGRRMTRAGFTRRSSRLS